MTPRQRCSGGLTSRPSGRPSPFPPRIFLNALLVRGAVLWFGVRLAAAFVGAPFPGPPFPLVTTLAATWIVALAALLGTLDAGRRHELLLLGNFGVRPVTVAMLAGLPAALAEGLIRLWAP
jgi:hypothetical protein